MACVTVIREQTAEGYYTISKKVVSLPGEAIHEYQSTVTYGW